MYTNGFLSNKERSSLVVNVGNAVAMPADPGLPDGMRDATIVIPDAAYCLSRDVFPAQLSCFPRVVFEVAYKQSYESLKEGAREWLLRGQGLVKLVMVVKLVEETPKRRNRKRTANDLTDKHRDGQGPGDSSSLVVHNGQQDSDQATIAYMSSVSSDNIFPSVEEPINSFEDLYYYDLDKYIMYPGGDGSWMSNPEQAPIITCMSTISPAETSPAKAAPATTPTVSETGSHQGNFAPLDPDLAPFVGRISGFIELYRYHESTNTVYQDGPRYVRLLFLFTSAISY